jgi:branched-chain amino acid transport system substrate-binding protein
MASKLARRAVIGSSVALARVALTPRVQAAEPVRIGVLSDMSGLYSANSVYGSVVGAMPAIEDFKQDNPDMDIQLIQGAFQKAQLYLAVDLVLTC